MNSRIGNHTQHSIAAVQDVKDGVRGHIIGWFPSVGLLIAFQISATKETILFQLVAIC